MGNSTISNVAMNAATEVPQSTSSSQKQVEWRSRKVDEIIPTSHNDDAIGVIVIAAAVVFLVSIIFWAVGASTGLVGLEIVGKIFFSLIISAVGLLIIFLAGQHLLAGSQSGFSMSGGGHSIRIR